MKLPNIFGKNKEPVPPEEPQEPLSPEEYQIQLLEDVRAAMLDTARESRQATRPIFGGAY